MASLNTVGIVTIVIGILFMYIFRYLTLVSLSRASIEDHQE